MSKSIPPVWPIAGDCQRPPYWEWYTVALRRRNQLDPLSSGFKTTWPFLWSMVTAQRGLANWCAANRGPDREQREEQSLQLL